MVGRGRRPGNVDTRAEIIDAARAVFSEGGYAQASIRAIARRARVDPALVHHYFADKAALFAETMALPADPRRIKDEVEARGFNGELLVERFLAQWERGGSPEVADNVRQFVTERVGLHGAPGDDQATRELRRSLVSSQLLGIAWTRYVMRMEPMASASRAQVARWAGPNIDRYALGPLFE
jgi:AcrR family transcriptional regulator